MAQKPWVIIKSALSLDGFIGSSGTERLILSNPEDFDELDALRAEVDAVMVGANTLRADNPKLLVKSELRCQARERSGLPAQPTLVSFTATGELDPALNFFNQPQTKIIVYSTERGAAKLRVFPIRNGEICTLGAGPVLDVKALLTDLGKRGVRKLLVEGGERTNSAFIQSGAVDCLELSVAPRFAGSAGRARFASLDLALPGVKWKVISVRQLGDMMVCRLEAAKP